MVRLQMATYCRLVTKSTNRSASPATANYMPWNVDYIRRKCKKCDGCTVAPIVSGPKDTAAHGISEMCVHSGCIQQDCALRAARQSIATGQREYASSQKKCSSLTGMQSHTK